MPQHADHIEDFRDVAPVESMNGNPLSDQRGDDVGLEIGEADDEIRMQVKDFRETRGLSRRASGGRTQ
jgi:hypothetical protein